MMFILSFTLEIIIYYEVPSFEIPADVFASLLNI